LEEPLRKVKVNITKYISTEAGLRYCSAVITSNGRIKQNIVLVGGKEERHPEGSYYLDWRENGVRVRLSVGKNAQDALTQRDRKTFELNAANHGVVLQSEVQNGDGSNSDGHRSLAAAVTEYLADIKLNKKHKTHAAYSTALDYFLESCKKPHLEDIDRRDMLKFSAFLRDEKNQAPRSIHNKFSNVLGFLRSQGITEKIVKKEDWPQYTEEETEVYEREDLNVLFAKCDPEERLWFEFFLQTGMREQEVMYCCWKDVNLAAATVRVSHKPDYSWTPKAYRERTIPVPETLVDSLKAWKAKAIKGCSLIFPTAGCRPKMDFLDCLKACAERAELDQDEFWLHKFRATFATWHLWAGIDLSTVQLWLGHKDLASTMRYLKPSRSQATRDKVNATFAAGGAQ
jgi:integrase/recombinase XerD